jgi:hypothetical protein
VLEGAEEDKLRIESPRKVPAISTALLAVAEPSVATAIVEIMVH